MFRPRIAFALLLAALCAPPPAATPPGSIGSTVRPFTLRQPDGGTVTLPEHHKDAKAVVVVCVSFECPVAKSYFAPLGDLAKTYAAKGVAFVAVCPDEGAAEV